MIIIVIVIRDGRIVIIEDRDRPTCYSHAQVALTQYFRVNQHRHRPCNSILMKTIVDHQTILKVNQHHKIETIAS